MLALSLLVGCGPSDPIAAARQQVLSGDVEGGLETIRELLDEDGDNPELLFLYARLLNRTGQPGLAEWPLRKAMQNPVWFEKAATLLATVEQAGGNYENAVKVYDEILERNPDDLDIRIQRANACAKSPVLFEEALAEADRILEIDPDELGAFKPRVLAYLGLNKPEEAGEAMEELGERIDAVAEPENPIRGWHCATMAIFASDSGDVALARERWAICEEEFPTHQNVVSQAIEFHMKMGELERALEVAQTAFAADTADGSGYRLTIADLLRQLERPEEAEALLIEASELNESPVSRTAALLALTEHYKIQGDVDAAASTLERALAVAQNTIGPQPDLLFSLADLSIQNGDFDRALALSAEMSVPAHRSLVRARVAHERKQYAKAMKLYQDTSRLWPENPYAPYHEARAALSAGLFDRAFKSYLLSVRVDETATDARLQAARLLMAEGRTQPALEMLSSSRATSLPEAQLLVVEIRGQTRGAVTGTNAANRMSQSRPEYYGQAIEAAARGASRRKDPREAWAVLAPKIELQLPPANRFPILRAAVLYAPGEDELEEVRVHVEKAVTRFPQVADVREIEGMLSERLGAPAEAMASYKAALEIDPARVDTLLRLAKVEAELDPEASIGSLRKALDVQAKSVRRFDDGLFLAAVGALPSSQEVTSLLEDALELAPTSGGIAYRLALDLESGGGDSDRLARLASRAVRFQAGEGAVELRDRLSEQG